MTDSPLSLHALSEALPGHLIGDGGLLVRHLKHPRDAQTKEDLVLLMDPKLVDELHAADVVTAILSKKSEHLASRFKASIIVERPRLAMARLTNLFLPHWPQAEAIHPSAVIEDGAIIGAGTRIGAHVYIAAGAVIGERCLILPQVYIGPNAHIGSDAVIFAGTRIGHDIIIGDRVIIHYNASIGADGFSFVTPEAGSVETAKSGGGSAVTAHNTHLLRIASLGAVVIGDDVEIGANTAIDRGTVTSTRIGNGTKIDNHVQIGHNVVVGENCLICGRVGIAGSAVVGDRVVLGGATGIADHVHIGNDAIAMGMSGIAGNVASGTIVGGTPAVPRDKMMENVMNIGRLGRALKRIETLEERLAALEAKTKSV